MTKNPKTTLASACVLVAIICLAIEAEYGGSVCALVTVVMFIALILVVSIKSDLSQTWALAALAPALMPFLLLGFVAATVAVPLDVRFSAHWEAVLDSLHVTSLLTSGPLGVVVTLAAEDNFPRDQDWVYGLLLCGGAAVQWLAVFTVGSYLIRRARNPRAMLFLCVGAAYSIFAVTFVLHVLILAARHS